MLGKLIMHWEMMVRKMNSSAVKLTIMDDPILDVRENIVQGNRMQMRR